MNSFWIWLTFSYIQKYWDSLSVLTQILFGLFFITFKFVNLFSIHFQFYRGHSSWILLSFSIKSQSAVSGFSHLTIFFPTWISVYCDLMERNRMTFYRDKSLMFGSGRERNEGEPPVWGGDYWKVPDSFFKFK